MARLQFPSVARVATIVAVLGTPCVASAADLLPPPPPEAPAVEFAGAWYLRGDVGASVYTAPTYSATDGLTKNFFNSSQGGGFFGGVGVGYQFNNFFRADITGEFRSTDLRFGSFIDFGAAGSGNYARVFNLSNGHYNAGVFLANGYFDIGTWYGITPFVGGGVGVALNSFSGWTDSGTISFYEPFVNNLPTSPGIFKARTTESFAWALHAGLAYDVTPNFKVELAYRYLNTGHAKTGVLTCLDASITTACTTVVKARNLEAHDIKLGFRYLLGAPMVAALPPLMPEPLVRKY
ncbi:outer membrane protein [Methylobacterium aerolatum]|uniref:Opacity protein-like surface antigen n=1 Tax=Methylobacterium aerolatum TaxID=418708 RepID=A0ABU0HVA8_9HYPH|nr:outer membrane beta-barrel protein [Methylobacterium aerolatum]MDQ0445645.1 opacity protein-like surface antigen [Methylobacterium aerolatum]GJD36246.1 hypothetical protein FMGBMHLM_3161 [Methylobacterium aerolatum]